MSAKVSDEIYKSLSKIEAIFSSIYSIAVVGVGELLTPERAMVAIRELSVRGAALADEATGGDILAGEPIDAKPVDGEEED